MKVSKKLLLNELEVITLKVIDDVEKLKRLSKESLQFKSSPESWSALECIEHLNRYSAFYILEINRVLSASREDISTEFKSGIFGDYFAKSMQLKPKLNKMRTFKTMDPIYSKIDISVIDTFINYQKDTLKILNEVNLYNIRKLKTRITISNLIKLRLGDTLRVVIYHNERHIAQALRSIG